MFDDVGAHLALLIAEPSEGNRLDRAAVGNVDRTPGGIGRLKAAHEGRYVACQSLHHGDFTNNGARIDLLSLCFRHAGQEDVEPSALDELRKLAAPVLLVLFYQDLHTPIFRERPGELAVEPGDVRRIEAHGGV